MARLFPDELTCDFAETYHIYDWRQLPGRYAATLAAGLRDNARIKIKMSGTKVSAELMLLATCADALKLLLWQNTKDGAKGRNAPDSILSAIIGKEKETGAGFDTPEEFKAWRKSKLRR
jgi:hypothetical protein